MFVGHVSERFETCYVSESAEMKDAKKYSVPTRYPILKPRTEIYVIQGYYPYYLHVSFTLLLLKVNVE